MRKKIAVINDLSGFGRCSLTAAISAIAAMGVEPCPLPTAVLSAQTGYPSYYCDDYTDKMEYFRSEWEKMGVSFDGIYTGFMAGSRQIEKVFDFLDTFHRPGTFLLVDPVMGDNGKNYDMFTPELLDMMRMLAAKADLITPNVTELCLLAEESYDVLSREADKENLLKKIEDIAWHVMKDGPKEIVVTGIRFADEKDGTEKMGNLAVSEAGTKLAAFPFAGESYSGTGDLFASVIAGGKARGDSLADSMELAGKMISLAIKDSVLDQVPRNDGVNYEQYLWMLADKKYRNQMKEVIVP